MAETKRTAYFDVLRVVATFAVMLIHLCVPHWEALSPSSAGWLTVHLLDSACRWSVPIFVMISGALFLNPEREISFGKICRKNLARIGIAFGIWSAVYTLLDWAKGAQLRDLPLIFLKGEYHMWFLFLIAGLYLFTPLLRKLTASPKRTQWFLVLGGVFFFLIPRGVHLLSLFGIHAPFEALILKAMNINGVSVCYLFVFVLGHILHQTQWKKPLRIFFYCLGALGFFATVFLTLWHTRMLGAPSGSFYSYMSLNVMAMAVALFVWAKTHCKKVGPSLLSVSKYSFGMYLIHPLCIELVTLGAEPFWMVAPNAVFVFAFSYLLSRICKL